MPVSGPGAYSQRTDKQPVRNPGGLPYGQNQQLQQMQKAAPLPQTPQIPVTPIHAPTESPSEPVTAGAASGPGPGPSILTQGAPQAHGSPLVTSLSQAAASDPSGAIASLLVEAMKRGM
jgi:hypothetical protein